MKKKVLCVMLSMTLCASMILEVGAAVAADPQAQEEQQETEEKTDLPSTDEETEQGEENETEETTVPVEEDDTDFGTDEEVEPTPTEKPEAEEESVQEETVTEIRTDGLVHKHLVDSQGIVSGDDVEWVQDENGNYQLYCHVDGCDSAYFTANDGIVGVQSAEGTSYYYFDQNGYMVTGAAEIQASDTGLPKEDGIYYFLGVGENNSDGVIETSKVALMSASISPMDSQVGTLQNGWKWTPDKATGKSHWYYYDESGKRLSLDELKAKQSDPGNTIFEIVASTMH